MALAETLASFLPDPQVLQLKWPNDVLLNGGKLAGILVDSAATPAGAVEWLVIGIGVNLVAAPNVPGRAIACLAEFVSPPPAEDFAGVLLTRLRSLADRAGPGRVRCRAGGVARRAPALGSAVTLRLGERRIGGGFAGLADDGSLLLSTDGRVARVRHRRSAVVMRQPGAH